MNSKETIASTPVHQQFEPSIEWVTEEDCNTVLIYLPGFTKEQLRVQLRSRTLIISGERKLHDNTLSQFRKEFLVSEHCYVNKVSAKFEGNILFVKQPKLIAPVAAGQEGKSSIETPENSMDEREKHQKKTQVEPNSKPTSISQSNGGNGVGQNMKNDAEKNANLKGPKGVCENASEKKAGDLGFVMKMKPSRNAMSKILILVVGFVVGFYCSNVIKSWIV